MTTTRGRQNRLRRLSVTHLRLKIAPRQCRSSRTGRNVAIFLRFPFPFLQHKTSERCTRQELYPSWKLIQATYREEAALSGRRKLFQAGELAIAKWVVLVYHYTITQPSGKRRVKGYCSLPVHQNAGEEPSGWSPLPTRVRQHGKHACPAGCLCARSQGLRFSLDLDSHRISFRWVFISCQNIRPVRGVR